MTTETFRTNGATIPDSIAALVDDIADKLEIPRSEFFVADHTHEQLRGSFSIACEGNHYGWSFLYTNKCFAAGVSWAEGGWFIEPLTGWGLGVYPA